MGKPTIRKSTSRDMPFREIKGGETFLDSAGDLWMKIENPPMAFDPNKGNITMVNAICLTTGTVDFIVDGHIFMAVDIDIDIR